MWSIAGMCHLMCGTSFSVSLIGQRRQLLTGPERGCDGRRLQRRETIPVMKKMRRLRCSVPWIYRERKQSSDGGLNREEVHMSVEGVVVRRGGMLCRGCFECPLRRGSPVVDYNLAAGGRRGMTQPRIDTGSWTQKGKNTKEAIGKAWSKFFHIAGVPGRQADSPYFVSAVRETQKWGKFPFIGMTPMNLHSCIS